MSSAAELAKPIKLFILDVDGVLTPGTLFYGDQEMQLLQFHVIDGQGIKMLQQTGVTLGIISGRRSKALIQRLDELGISHRHLGCHDKRPAYNALKAELKLSDAEIAYMGDDLPDLPLLKQAGLAITVPTATPIIKQHVDFTTESMPGHGAVREACEFIMKAQGKYESVVQSYLV